MMKICLEKRTLVLQVRCTRGYDGGLPQSFILEAKDNHNYAVVAKIQASSNISLVRSTASPETLAGGK